MGSRLEMILLGYPCNLQIICVNNLAVLQAVKRAGKVSKCNALENLSITSKITVWPCVQVIHMKSIATSSQMADGGGIGSRTLEVALVGVLFVGT